MRRQVIEIGSLDFRERSSSIEPGSARNCRRCPHVDEPLVARQHARATAIEAHFERLRFHKTPIAQDQFGSACFVVLQMRGNLALNHVAFALANLGHINPDGSGHGAELRTIARHMRHLRAPNLVLAGHAVDIGTAAPTIPALHDDSLSPGLRHVPSQELATNSTTKDQDFIPFRLSHYFPPSFFYSRFRFPVRIPTSPRGGELERRAPGTLNPEL